MDNFSDRLSPGQVSQILDALDIPWRDYSPNNDGWIDLENIEGFQTAVGFNLEYGGFSDHFNGETGDLVRFVELHEDCNNYQAIQKIKHTLKIQGVNIPDLKDGYLFANHFLGLQGKNFVRLPIEILRSKLSGNDKIVWSAIFSRCGKKEFYSFAGIRRLSDDTGLSKSTVQSSIKTLKGCGVLFEEHRGKNKAPARFPVVADTQIIDKNLSAVLKYGQRCTKVQDSDCTETQDEIRYKELDSNNQIQKQQVQNGFCTLYTDDILLKRIDCSHYRIPIPSGNRCQPCEVKSFIPLPGKKRKIRKERARRWEMKLEMSMN